MLTSPSVGKPQLALAAVANLAANAEKAPAWLDLTVQAAERRKYLLRIRLREIRNQAGCPTRLAREGGRKSPCRPLCTAACSVFDIAGVLSSRQLKPM